MTVWDRLMLLMILLCFLTACEPGSYDRTNLSMHLSEIIPDDWNYMGGQHINTDGEGEREWLVIYRFDVAGEGDQHGYPINAAVYREDDHRPPNLLPYDLHTADKSYLCECRCSAVMEDVLSGIPGDELVIRDECSGRITRLAIFNWDAGQDEYLPRGHFAGYCIEVELDKVEIRHRLQDRAQLMMLWTYRPLHSQAYYLPGGHGALVAHEKYEYDFCTGVPEHVTLSPYPEKVVLAFYRDYNKDEEEVAKYFTRERWKELEECEHNHCGCAMPREEVAHVRVTDLAPQLESEEPDEATVRASVVCEHMNGTTGNEVKLQWLLVRGADSRWKLEGVEFE
jgi:hypothetical protein